MASLDEANEGSLFSTWKTVSNAVTMPPIWPNWMLSFDVPSGTLALNLNPKRSSWHLHCGYPSTREDKSDEDQPNKYPAKFGLGCANHPTHCWSWFGPSKLSLLFPIRFLQWTSSPVATVEAFPPTEAHPQPSRCRRKSPLVYSPVNGLLPPTSASLSFP